MPDGQSGVLESLDAGVNVERAPLTAPIAAAPQYERPAYVLDNRKWGSSNFGSNGGAIRWAIIGPGTVYPSQEYTDAATPIDPVFHSTIRAAFDRWEQVGNFDFVESYSGLADIVVIWDELSGRGSGTIGLANTYFSGSQILHSYISFDIGRRYSLLDGTVLTVGTPQNSNTLSLYTLALHEIGHALGLDHEDDLPTIMNSYDSPAITDLTADELAGIEAIYGVKGSTAPPDDYAASTSTTGTIVVGGTANGAIELGNDSDWFRVTLTAGTTYRINLDGGTLTDPLLILRNSSGTRITSDDDSGTGLNAQLSYTPTVTGTYYIDAQGATYTGTGTYSLTLTQTSSADDYAATTATTGVVTTSAPTTGVINSASDRDWFRLSLTAGTTYSIRMAAGTGSAITDPAMYLLNSSGTLVSGSNGSGGPSITFTPTTSGAYYIDAISRSGTGAYSISMTATTPPQPDDFGASTSTTGRFPIIGGFGLYVGRIETPGDHDWYNITLVGGTTYRFELQGTERPGYTLPNPMLTLRNSVGAVITSDDDSGTGASSLFYYTAPASGAYFLDASDAGAGTGVYYVYAASDVVIPDDYTATTATTGVVAVGGAATGNIEAANDRDWFRVTLQAGQSYRVAATGALTSPVVSLMNSAGTVVADDAVGGQFPDGQLTYTAAAAGTYYVGVRSNSSSATGAYTVSVGFNDDFAASTATTGSVTLGSFASGAIESAGDVDWVRVNLTAGTLYQFDGRGNASSGGTLSDPAMSLLNSSGTVLITDNDSSTDADSRILFKPMASGTYYLALRSNTASGTGTYRVVATANPDDYAAATTTAGFMPVGGAVGGLVETAGDRDWFRTVLTAGTTYTVQLAGTATGSSLRWTESSLVLRDSGGNQVTSATANGLGAAARLTFTASSSGAFYLDALAYSTGVGSYSISIAAGGAQTAEESMIAEGTGISAADLAAVMAPPAIALDEAPLQMVRSTTVLVDNPVGDILKLPPRDLFAPPADLQNPFMSTPLDQLFQQQPSNSYNLLPF